jgi:heat shock protein HslJ
MLRALSLACCIVALPAAAFATDPSATPSPTATQPPRLEGTYWKLTELAGKPPATVAGTPEAYLRFDAATKRIAGLGGCNQLMGSYELRGSSLTIAAGGMTMTACPDPLDKQELTFTDALRATKGYRLVDGALELLDGATVLAHFVARQ